MIFTRNNVQTVLRGVRKIDYLGLVLGVSEWRRREIVSQFGGNDGQQKKKFVDYFMDHDPLASWRRVIGVLDELKLFGGEPEKIRYLVEAVTGECR